MQQGNKLKEGLCLQEIGVKLGLDADGQLRFTVTDTVEEAREAARALQVWRIKARGHLSCLWLVELAISGMALHYPVFVRALGVTTKGVGGCYPSKNTQRVVEEVSKPID